MFKLIFSTIEGNEPFKIVPVDSPAIDGYLDTDITGTEAECKAASENYTIVY